MPAPSRPLPVSSVLTMPTEIADVGAVAHEYPAAFCFSEHVSKTIRHRSSLRVHRLNRERATTAELEVQQRRIPPRGIRCATFSRSRDLHGAECG